MQIWLCKDTSNNSVASRWYEGSERPMCENPRQGLNCVTNFELPQRYFLYATYTTAASSITLILPSYGA
ncbi:hypothetical protein TNCV_3916821 [Trichonephila clavipes]|nr:hypothetical protein TNCV_3916821 [Trichonephila clavipes]